MNKEFYISLISKKLSNELNTAELKDLNAWISRDSDNSALLDQFKSTWELSAGYKQTTAFDPESAFASFAEKYQIPTSDNPLSYIPNSDAGKKVSNIPARIISGALLIALLLTSIYLIRTSGIIGDKASSNPMLSPNATANLNMDPLSIGLSDNSTVTLSPNSYYLTPENKDVKFTSLNLDGEGPKGSDSNSDSSVSFADIDTDATQDAFFIENFIGQGYFDIHASNGDKAMKIGIQDGTYVIAEDASFNLQNYEDDNFNVIDVQTGDLTFISGAQVVRVDEGKRLIYNEKSKEYKIVGLPKINPFQWHKGVLVFDNTPLVEAFVMIERFYGVDIDITDDSKLDSTSFTATHYKSSSLNACLELIQEIKPMDIQRVGQRDIEVSNVGVVK